MLLNISAWCAKGASLHKPVWTEKQWERNVEASGLGLNTVDNWGSTEILSKTFWRTKV